MTNKLPPRDGLSDGLYDNVQYRPKVSSTTQKAINVSGGLLKSVGLLVGSAATCLALPVGMALGGVVALGYQNQRKVFEIPKFLLHTSRSLFSSASKTASTAYREVFPHKIAFPEDSGKQPLPPPTAPPSKPRKPAGDYITIGGNYANLGEKEKHSYEIPDQVQGTGARETPVYEEPVTVKEENDPTYQQIGDLKRTVGQQETQSPATSGPRPQLPLPQSAQPTKNQPPSHAYASVQIGDSVPETKPSSPTSNDDKAYEIVDTKAGIESPATKKTSEDALSTSEEDLEEEPEEDTPPLPTYAEVERGTRKIPDALFQEMKENVAQLVREFPNYNHKQRINELVQLSQELAPFLLNKENQTQFTEIKQQLLQLQSFLDQLPPKEAKDLKAAIGAAITNPLVQAQVQNWLFPKKYEILVAQLVKGFPTYTQQERINKLMQLSRELAPFLLNKENQTQFTEIKQQLLQLQSFLDKLPSKEAEELKAAIGAAITNPFVQAQVQNWLFPNKYEIAGATTASSQRPEPEYLNLTQTTRPTKEEIQDIRTQLEVFKKNPVIGQPVELCNAFVALVKEGKFTGTVQKQWQEFCALAEVNFPHYLTLVQDALANTPLDDVAKTLFLHLIPLKAGLEVFKKNPVIGEAVKLCNTFAALIKEGNVSFAVQKVWQEFRVHAQEKLPQDLKTVQDALANTPLDKDFKELFLQLIPSEAPIYQQVRNWFFPKNSLPKPVLSTEVSPQKVSTQAAPKSAHSESTGISPELLEAIQKNVAQIVKGFPTYTQQERINELARLSLGLAAFVNDKKNQDWIIAIKQQLPPLLNSLPPQEASDLRAAIGDQLHQLQSQWGGENVVFLLLSLISQEPSPQQTNNITTRLQAFTKDPVIDKAVELCNAFVALVREGKFTDKVQEDWQEFCDFAQIHFPENLKTVQEALAKTPLDDTFKTLFLQLAPPDTPIHQQVQIWFFPTSNTPNPAYAYMTKLTEDPYATVQPENKDIHQKIDNFITNFVSSTQEQNIATIAELCKAFSKQDLTDDVQARNWERFKNVAPAIVPGLDLATIQKVLRAMPQLTQDAQFKNYFLDYLSSNSALREEVREWFAPIYGDIRPIPPTSSNTAPEEPQYAEVGVRQSYETTEPVKLFGGYLNSNSILPKVEQEIKNFITNFSSFTNEQKIATIAELCKAFSELTRRAETTNQVPNNWKEFKSVAAAVVPSLDLETIQKVLQERPELTQELAPDTTELTQDDLFKDYFLDYLSSNPELHQQVELLFFPESTSQSTVQEPIYGDGEPIYGDIKSPYNDILTSPRPEAPAKLHLFSSDAGILDPLRINERVHEAINNFSQNVSKSTKEENIATIAELCFAFSKIKATPQVAADWLEFQRIAHSVPGLDLKAIQNELQKWPRFAKDNVFKGYFLEVISSNPELQREVQNWFATWNSP